MKLILNVLLLWSCLAPHDFHVSIAQVEYKDEVLQMTLRVFTEDLEDRLEELSALDLDLGTETEHPEAAQWMQKYLKKRVAFASEGRVLNQVFIGYEVEFELCYIYLEFPVGERPSELTVRNRIFFDSFDDQSNIVNVQVGEELRSAFLSPGKGDYTLEF